MKHLSLICLRKAQSSMIQFVKISFLPVVDGIGASSIFVSSTKRAMKPNRCVYFWPFLFGHMQVFALCVLALSHAASAQNAQNQGRPPAKNAASGALVTPAIESVEWLSVDKAADGTPAEGAPLDNNPPSVGVGKRIFADKETVADQRIFDRVRVRVGVVDASVGMKVYLQVFDVDDPSIGSTLEPGIPPARQMPEDTDPDHGKDNGWVRGLSDLKTVPVQVVEKGEDGRMRGYVFFDYGISTRPGDNYRVGVALKEEDIKKLTVDAQVAEGSLFVPCDNEQIPSFKGRLSEVLTVWRRLHIERDSMRAPQDNENKVVGKITKIETLNDGAMQFDLHVEEPDGTDSNLVNSRAYVQEEARTGTMWVDDMSPNLDSPGSNGQTANGRFEKGIIHIGTSAEVTTIDLLQGNGATFVRTSATPKPTLPFTISMQDKASITGSVTGLTKVDDRVVVTVVPTNGALTPGSYAPSGLNGAVKATIKIAGHSFAVSNNTANQVLLEPADAELDFTLQDDDQLTYTGRNYVSQQDETVDLLPHTPKFDDEAIRRFEQVYILPVLDGGGNPANDKNTVEFRRNISQVRIAGKLPGAYESSNAPNFWVVNLITVYQSTVLDPTKNRSDGDSSVERYGLAFAEISGLHAVFCREDHRESSPSQLFSTGQEALVWVHEIGHLFGLPDRYDGSNNDFGDLDGIYKGAGGIMGTHSMSNFINRDRKNLRASRPGSVP